MVGEGVMHECLMSDKVEQVLVINRKPCGVTHPKVKELIHKDFSEFSSVENELKGYNAAFLCMGITSIGASEEQYTKVTYDYTMALARTLIKLNADTTVCYISGAGTKQEGAKNMWIRVKGKTERELLLLCKNGYMFRPGYIRPIAGMKNTYRVYKALDWMMFPLLKLMAPKSACTLSEIGRAMIHCAAKGYNKQVLEVKDIEKAAKV